MAIFREFDSRGRDRSAEDRRRHRELVDDAIKKNIGNIIAEESIIGQSTNKKIKIPIKGIKEYQFVFGKNQYGTGSGNGEEKRGDKIGNADDMKEGHGEAGNNEGEDIYETEVTIEELIQYLFEDLNLPFLERKKFNQLETEKNYRKLGIKRKGIPPKLAKKRSVIEKIKRQKAYQRGKKDEVDKTEEKPRFPFKEDDLRYYRLREDIRKESNAVIICIMDTSGSMDVTKKYLARSFYFLLYQFIRLKYVNVEIAFVAHTTIGKEVNEDDFFHKGESGGTYISSGYEKALEIIEARYNPSIWNVYAFHCSDGDNWSEDNEKALALAKKLCDTCNLFGYGEIFHPSFPRLSNIWQLYTAQLKNPNFSVVTMSKKEDVIPALRKLLEKEEKY
ncbi:MAG: sporulation protein YhbH [Firmicutes bacterium HGW-Firmicutes-1]|nr:MAG: sporulation protein YhbH [Firmicutes bacterium HGW-Firmicutes-1]